MRASEQVKQLVRDADQRLGCVDGGEGHRAEARRQVVPAGAVGLRAADVVVLDADDDISAAKHEPRTISGFGKLMLDHPQKFKASLQHYRKVIVASDYLKNLFIYPAYSA